MAETNFRLVVRMATHLPRPPKRLKKILTDKRRGKGTALAATSCNLPIEKLHHFAPVEDRIILKPMEGKLGNAPRQAGELTAKKRPHG